MHVVIARVNELLYDGEAVSLTVPGSAGEMTVLPQHEPLISTLKPGTVTVRSKDGDKTFVVENGVVEVRHDGATIIL